MNNRQPNLSRGFAKVFLPPWRVTQRDDKPQNLAAKLELLIMSGVVLTTTIM